MTSKFWALVLGALILFCTPALATVWITEDGGGVITKFEERYAIFKAAHEDVAIDGICASACTLVFTMPKWQVCYTDRAKLGFHSAFSRAPSPFGLAPPEFSQEGTDMVWKAYPENLRALLRSRGWDGGELEGWKEGRLIWLDPADMRLLGYRGCGEPKWRWALRMLFSA
jgi:hypothetical protein